MRVSFIALMSGSMLFAQTNSDLDWQAMAAKIIERLAPEPGEKILILSTPGRFQALVPPLRRAVVERGAVDLGNLQTPALADNAGFDQTSTALKTLMRTADAVLKLPGAEFGPAYRASQDVLREGRGRTVHFHWEGAYPVLGQPLPTQTVIDSVYQNALLATDYAEVARLQRDFEEALRGATVRVTTPAGTDVRFQIGDRPLTRQDGNASAAKAAQARNLIDREIELPCGAIRVAPLEETVEGVVVFPYSSWNGFVVDRVEMQLEKGKVSSWEATRRDPVAAEMAANGEAGRSFREFALGFNPRLAVPEKFPWIPYYGYGAGVVRLSLGDNTELGGKVSGGYVRWNFFTDATVEVGDTVWVKDGKLILP